MPKGFRNFIYVWISVLSELGYPVVESALGDAVLLEPLVIGKAAAAAFHDEIEAILRGEIPNIHDVASLIGVKWFYSNIMSPTYGSYNPPSDLALTV